MFLDVLRFARADTKHSFAWNEGQWLICLWMLHRQAHKDAARACMAARLRLTRPRWPSLLLVRLLSWAEWYGNE